MASNLDREFLLSASGPSGPCPLPEPGRDFEGAVEHPQLLSIRQQPQGYNYDVASDTREARRFVGFVFESVTKGEISFFEAIFLLLKGNFLS